MERNRCTHCRNPIRHGGDVFATSPGGEESWFHPDCWTTVQAAKQKDYVRAVETRGLEALLAPYITAVPTGSRVVGLAVAHVVAQGMPSDIRAVKSAVPLPDGRMRQ